MGSPAARRTAHRLDRLSARLPAQGDGTTLGDLLDRVDDHDARAMLTRCAQILLTSAQSGAEHADAARCLHEALFSERFSRNPSLADLLSLVDPSLPRLSDQLACSPPARPDVHAPLASGRVMRGDAP